MLYLCALAVVLVLARELLALELVKHLSDSLCGFRQHRFERDARRELTLFPKPVQSDVEERGDDEVITRKFAVQAGLSDGSHLVRSPGVPCYLYTCLMTPAASSSRAASLSLFIRLFAEQSNVSVLMSIAERQKGTNSSLVPREQQHGRVPQARCALHCLYGVSPPSCG